MKHHALGAAAIICVGCSDPAAYERIGSSVAALTLSPSFDLEGTPPTTGDDLPPLATLVPTGAGSLLFTRQVIDDVGEALVQPLDAAGAPVPGGLRGIPATFGLVGPSTRPNVWAASYGAGALVVVQDRQYRFVGARVDNAGRSIDRAPFVFFTPPSPVYNQPAGVACNPTHCLVAFQNGARMQAVRFAVDGRVLDAAPLDLGTTTGVFTRDSLVALPDRFIVAWNDLPPGGANDIRVGRVTLDGRVLDPGGRPVTTAGGVRSDPALATDGTNVFLQWSATASGARPDGAYTQLLDRDLTALGALGVHADLRYPVWRLAWDGAQYVLSDGSSRFVRFNAAGARTDPAFVTVEGGADGTVWAGGVPGGFVFAAATAPFGLQRYASTGARLGGRIRVPERYRYDSAPAVDSDGRAFLAGWYRDPFAVQLARVSTAGSLVDNPSVPVAAGLDTPPAAAVALDGAVGQAFAASYGMGGCASYAVNLGTRAVAAPGFCGSSAFIQSQAPVRSATQRLLLQLDAVIRYDASWGRLDPRPIQFTTEHVLGATADFDGTHFFLAYYVDGLAGNPANASMFARRLNADGDFVESAPRDLSSLGVPWSAPRVAFGGGTHLLTWVDRDQRVVAARLALDGSPGPQIVLGATSGLALPPTLTPFPHGLETTVTFNGTNFVVVWFHRGERRLRAVRVTPAGVALDPTPLILSEGGPTSPASVAFATTSDGRGSTLVAYEAYDLDLWARRVRGVIVRDDGVVAPDAGLDAAATPDASPDVVAPDAARDAGVDAVVTPDAVAPPDAARDAGVDAITPDVITPDAVTLDAAIAPDAAVTPDAATLDAAVAPDATVAPDAANDAAIADVPMPTDATSDRGRDASPDVTAAPDADLADAADDVAAPADAGPPPGNGGSCDASCTVGADLSRRADRRGWQSAVMLALVASWSRRRARASRR
ncbi:MAG: hypothetical protein U0324_28265 [Polyangiales bacterium]